MFIKYLISKNILISLKVNLSICLSGMFQKFVISAVAFPLPLQINQGIILLYRK